MYKVIKGYPLPMCNKCISLFVLLLLLLISLPSYAADRYIHSGASGNNDGSDWENAWTDIPVDSRGYARLVRGDTVWVADGTYSRLNTAESKLAGGSLPDYIIIKKATASAHGSNVGWVDSYGDGVATWGGPMEMLDNMIFDGVVGSGQGAG